MRILRISLFLIAGAALGPVRVSAQYCNHKCPIELKDETGCCPEAAKPKPKPKARLVSRAKPPSAAQIPVGSASAPVQHCRYGQVPSSCGAEQAVDDNGCCPPPPIPASIAPAPASVPAGQCPHGRAPGNCELEQTDAHGCCPPPATDSPAASTAPTTPAINSAETDDRGIAWVNIPAGSYQMGCVPSDNGCKSGEKPRHQVMLSRFKMMTNLVTVAQFKVYARATGAYMESQMDWNGEDHPMVFVNWDEAKSYCAWTGGRLPTEAEWEYAARGGKEGLVYPWGNESSHDYANYSGTEGRDTWPKTSPVGSFPANGFGLNDMAGNAWEWVADYYEAGYYANSPSIDPKGPGSGSSRVLRGGSWFNAPKTIRSSYRDDHGSSLRSSNFGFRCVRD